MGRLNLGLTTKLAPEFKDDTVEFVIIYRLGNDMGKFVSQILVFENVEVVFRGPVIEKDTRHYFCLR